MSLEQVVRIEHGSPNAAVAGVASAAPARDVTTRGTVLVIDDESGILGAVGRILTKFGFTPLLALDGVEGLQLFEQHADAIDVVVLDWHLPAQSGQKTLAKLLDRRPDVRVVLATGDHDAELSQTDRAHIACLLLKPYSVAELMLAVGTLAAA
ncbi:MAG: response regulator [Gemmatimonadetes bacterium]|nr:response regulator [Gemmatimonadota bacterium]